MICYDGQELLSTVISHFEMEDSRGGGDVIIIGRASFVITAFMIEGDPLGMGLSAHLFNSFS